VRINPKAAGIDVDAKEHVVAVPCDRDPQPVRTFQAFILALLSQLATKMRYFSGRIAREGASIKEGVFQSVCSADQVSSHRDD
jgi:hypothetical protein